jgi:hypothetical protein
MYILSESDWGYDTSYEDSISVAIATGGRGRLYFRNGRSGAKLEVPYSYGALGTSKGAVVNYAKSVAATKSGGFGNVYDTPWGEFGYDEFPCFGWLVCIGATAGVFAPSFFDNSGKCVCLWVFGGMPPDSALLTWGNFDSALPSGGIAAGFIDFHYAVQK